MYSLKKNYKLIFLTTLSIAIGIVFNGCVVDSTPDHDNDYRYSATENFFYTASASNLNEIHFEGISGSMEIIGEAGLANVEISGEKEVRSDSRTDAQNQLKYLTVGIEEAGGALIVRTVQPEKSNGRDYNIYYTIRIPANWDQNIRQLNGPVTIQEMHGIINVELLNGELEIRDCEGAVHSAMTNGILRILNFTGSLENYTTNGNIIGDLSLPPDGICKIKTVNGTINLGIPQNTDAVFSAKVVNGSVSVSGLALQSVQNTQKSIYGILGNGDGLIELEAVNGTVLAKSR